MESIETTTDMVQDLLDVFQKLKRKGEFSRLEAWRSKKNSSSEEKKIHQPVQNNIYTDSECSDDNSDIKEDSGNGNNTKVAKDISVLEENKNETEKSSTPKTKENIYSDEKWTPPEFINCVKFYLDEFQGTKAAEAMIRKIFDDNNIIMKKLQIMYCTGTEENHKPAKLADQF